MGLGALGGGALAGREGWAGRPYLIMVLVFSFLSFLFLYFYYQHYSV